MMDLIFASHNLKKTTEAKEILPSFLQLKSLSDIGFYDEIIEDADTFEGNALLKATAVYEFANTACFADDSGLVVPSLGGLPGVKSARYASETGSVDHQANNQKLLNALKPGMDRTAYFITVICLMENANTPIYFEGRVVGRIALEPKGNLGFGYDPIFIPENFTKTFAELGAEVKNKISHRARALQNMVQHFHKSNHY